MPAIKPLTRRRRVALERFMERPGHPEGTLTYREMQGFLFTVACAPEMVVPSEWLPRVFGEGEPPFNTSKEAEAVMGGLMALFNEFAPGTGGPVARLPKDCAFRKDPLENLEPDAPIAQWCRGFNLGHAWLQEIWDACLPEELEEDFDAMLITLSFFASREAAEALAAGLAGSGQTLESLATEVREMFPNTLASYSSIGQSLFRASMPAGPEAQAPAATTSGPGRNDPCPCGSGRKYKKCCGRHVH